MSEEKYDDGAPVLTLEEIQGMTASGLFQIVKAVNCMHRIIKSSPEFVSNSSFEHENKEYVDSINKAFDIIGKMRGFE